MMCPEWIWRRGSLTTPIVAKGLRNQETRANTPKNITLQHNFNIIQHNSFFNILDDLAPSSDKSSLKAKALENLHVEKQKQPRSSILLGTIFLKS